MLPILESQRLIYRELVPSDDVYLFELDSDPEVHIYLGNNPVKHIDECRNAIADICVQYQKNGLGCLAVILKETGEFIGWAGLKLEHNVNGHDTHYDLGYRFMKKHWGMGYASEAASFFVNYGFNILKLERINAFADVPNMASRRVLEKAGLTFIETFDYEGDEEAWYEMSNPNV